MPVTQLSVSGYRSIRQLTLKLRGINVLVGPNGCGKSNLYNGMLLLARAASGRFALLRDRSCDFVDDLQLARQLRLKCGMLGPDGVEVTVESIHGHPIQQVQGDFQLLERFLALLAEYLFWYAKLGSGGEESYFFS